MLACSLKGCRNGRAQCRYAKLFGSQRLGMGVCTGEGVDESFEEKGALLSRAQKAACRGCGVSLTMEELQMIGTRLVFTNKFCTISRIHAICRIRGCVYRPNARCGKHEFNTRWTRMRPKSLSKPSFFASCKRPIASAHLASTPRSSPHSFQS